MEPEEAWSVELTQARHDGSKMANAIRSGTALAISDGSLKLRRGTSAAIMEDEGIPQSRIIILNRVPGFAEDQSPYRSELAGVCGIMTLTENLIRYYNIKSGSIRIGLDGESVVKRLQNPGSIKAGHRSFDLLQYITRKVEKMPITITFFGLKAIKMTKVIKYPMKGN